MTSTARTKIVKTQFVPRTVLLENWRVHKGVFLAFFMADDRPILSSVPIMK